MRILGLRRIFFSFLLLFGLLVLCSCGEVRAPETAVVTPSPAAAEVPGEVEVSPTPEVVAAADSIEEPAGAALLEVLTGEATFYYFTNFQNGHSYEVEDWEFEGEYLDLSGLLESYSDENVTWQVSEFSVVDMDGDGVPEVVVELFPAYVMHFVFHYEDGTVYGALFSHRGLGGLKKDGSFTGSGGAAHTSVDQLEFVDGVCRRVTLGNTDGAELDENGSWQGICYIDGERVSEEAFFAFWDEYDAKEDAVWYAYDEESLAELFSAAWETAA